MQSLLGILASLRPSWIADVPIWKLKQNGLFSIESFYSFTNFGDLRCPYYKIIWKVAILEKVKSFSLVISKKLIAYRSLS